MLFGMLFSCHIRIINSENDQFRACITYGPQTYVYSKITFFAITRTSLQLTTRNLVICVFL